jgi:DNA polymerase
MQVPVYDIINCGPNHRFGADGKLVHNSQKINMQNLSGSRPVNPKTGNGSMIMTPRGPERMLRFNKLHNLVQVADGTIIPCKDAKGDSQVHVAGLRDAIVAPPGKIIVVVDSSQIELRVAHLLAGQMDTIAELRQGEDVYSNFASTIYGRPITKKDYRERQHGKVGMLQLQYQSGWKSFRNAARIMGGVRLSEDESQATVQVYRQRYSMLPKFWRTCQQSIKHLAAGGNGRYLDDWGLCRIDHEQITLPGRLPLKYTNLREELLESFDGGDPELQWVYDDKEKRRMKKIYGGSITENLCQALARNVVFDQMMECEAKWGQKSGCGVVLTVHDEVVMVVDEDDGEDCLKFALECMKVSPIWWPQLPVAAEGGLGYRYSDAK